MYDCLACSLAASSRHAVRTLVLVWCAQQSGIGAFSSNFLVAFQHSGDFCRQRRRDSNTGTAGDSLADIATCATSNFAVLIEDQRDRSVDRLSFALNRQIAFAESVFLYRNI